MIEINNTYPLPDEITELLPDEAMVFLGYRGSIAHGTYVVDSIDDRDLIGVYVAPVEHYLGLGGGKGVKEDKRGEWDVVCYELKHFVTLLTKSNPNFLSTLFLPSSKTLISTPTWRNLLHNRKMFLSKQVYKSFTGYAHDQLKRMEKKEFKGYMGEKRKQLVEKFGFDCKHAAHLIRLLRMSIEFLIEHKLYVDRHCIDSLELVDIKRGVWTLQQVKAVAELLFTRAEMAFDNSTLPDYPDRCRIEQWLVTELKRHIA